MTLFIAAGLFPGLEHGAGFARSDKQAEVWRVRENMTTRFGAEWHKIGVLRRELNGIADVLADLRDLELFPAELTGLNKTNLIRYDKKIERLEKRHAQLTLRIEALRQPLLDALEILREMVVGQPVQSMFELLEQGDMKRIEEMLSVKHDVDTLWKSSDTLLTSMMVGIGIRAEHSMVPEESAEFFSIIKANLGQQSEVYYKKLAMIKDTLARRASKQHVHEMYAVELHRIKGYAKENKIPLCERKIAEVTARYKGKIDMGSLLGLSARIALRSGDYEKVLITAKHLREDGKTAAQRSLYRMQALYALGQYDTLWEECQKMDVTIWNGQQRNMVIWMSMESGLKLGEKDAYVKLASFVERTAPYALHVMHALGRSYLADNDPSTALSIFESAMKITARSDIDRVAARELRIAIAQTTYELGRYEKALSLFYNLINSNTEFERALYGILWCYLSLDMNDKAETTLRKLINQAPESPYAAEAFLVLAKRYLYKAQYEWKKVLYLTKEEQRLKELLERIDRRQDFEGSGRKSKKIGEAKRELTKLLGRIKAEPREAYENIVSYYNGIERVGTLISKHYSTGSFQNVTFTEKREQLLHYLDSVIMAATSTSRNDDAEAMITHRKKMQASIKVVVTKSSGFMTEAMIERFRFEREYLNWQKSQLNYYQQEAAKPFSKKTDSISRAVIKKSKKHYALILDSLLNVEEKMKRAWHKRLTAQLQSQLKRDMDSADAAYFHYQLGELYYARENEKYSKAFEHYEKTRGEYDRTIRQYRNGKKLDLPAEPKPPRIDHTASMGEFRNAIRLAPVSTAAASSHYSLAWCFNDHVRFDSALVHMEKVSLDFPKSPYAPQAWMYAGEYMFDKGNLSKAIQCYQSVMKYPESEWFDEALYKLAWSQYRLSNPEKAISSFLALVDLGGGKGAKGLLEKESMDYVAISFSEADMTGEKGLERATIFAKKLGDPDRGSQILHRLARVYKDQGRYDMSVKTYKRLLKMNPAYRNMPGVENEFLATLERNTTPEEANKMKLDFWKKYNKKSKWAKVQSDPEAIHDADSIAEKQLYEATIGFHQLALQKNDTSAYVRARDVYTDFIRFYPSSPRASECHYNLAEIEFSLGNYLKAAEEYIAVSKRYPDSKFRETAAWNAIVASQNLLKQEGTIR